MLDDLERNAEHFHPDVLHDDRLDHGLALEHARRGGSPFLPEVERALRAGKGLPALD